MSRNSTNPTKLFVFATIVLLLIAAALVEQRSQERAVDTAPLAAAHPTPEGIHIGVSEFEGPHLLEMAIPASDLIVIAKVSNSQPARWSTPDGKKPVDWEPNAAGYTSAMIYTPVTLEIQEVLRGEVGSHSVTVAILGGQVDNDRVDYSADSGFYTDVNTGDTALLFLQEAPGNLHYVAPYGYIDSFRLTRSSIVAGCGGHTQDRGDCRVTYDVAHALEIIRNWDTSPVELPSAPVEYPSAPSER